MLSKRPEYKALQDHREKMDDVRMRDLFAQDNDRQHKFSLKHMGLHVDFSRHRINDETLDLLMSLAKACDVESWREKMFSGEKINNSENRAVLHTAMRRPASDEVIVDDENVMPFIHDTLAQMQKFSDALRSGDFKGHTGKKITHVVNIGIGGSVLGPKMVCDTLKPYATDDISLHFVSNIDPSDISEALQEADPETTLFIIASKSFTTQETMANAQTAKDWLVNALGDEAAVAKHFIALSTNEAAVTAFGIDAGNMFSFRDWVGGRYSMWSPIGLSICIACGFDKFRELLDGAYVMDCHFREAPLTGNIPVILAMLGIWYRNFWDAQSYAVSPYDHYLSGLPEWLQQVDMESNGKSVDRDGNAVDYDTGPVVFGLTGTNGQHAFFQLIHQGTSLVPCDFIVALESHNPQGEQHKILLANMAAQADALMQGRTLDEANDVAHRVFAGNKPSTLLSVPKLDPFHLGMILALYEHKIFTQGIVWNINSFDQFGVELGKEMAQKMLASSTDFMKF